MGIRYSAQVQTVTPTAVADTTNFTDAAYFAAILGGASTMRVKINEIYLGGQAASTSSPTYWLLARDSTVGATGLSFSGGTTALIDGSSTAPTTLPSVFNTSTTKPQRSSTLKLLNLSMNAYGGIVRWMAAPDDEMCLVGSSASLGEISLSAFTGGTPGACGGHIKYEIM